MCVILSKLHISLLKSQSDSFYHEFSNGTNQCGRAAQCKRHTTNRLNYRIFENFQEKGRKESQLRNSAQVARFNAPVGSTVSESVLNYHSRGIFTAQHSGISTNLRANARGQRLDVGITVAPGLEGNGRIGRSKPS